MNRLPAETPREYPAERLEPTEHALAELVAWQGHGAPRVHISLAPDTPLDITSFRQSPSPSRTLSDAPAGNHIAIVDRELPVEAIRWLALERTIWATAYRRGDIEHQSVGRGFENNADDALLQHAIRQNVQISIGHTVCWAHRKFYQEDAHIRPTEADRYVAAYRRKHGIPVKAPFGVEIDRVRQQIYLRFDLFGLTPARQCSSVVCSTRTRFR